MTALAYRVKNYLSAVGAAAIYVSVHDQSPKSVGVCHDLDRTVAHLRQIIGLPVTLGWIAWAQSQEALVAIAKTPDLMVQPRADGVKIPVGLPELVERIMDMAERSAIVLTPHRIAVERAGELALSVERIFAELRATGRMAQFNKAYKSYRRSAEANGEKVLPYWKAQEQLRRVTIKALATSPGREMSEQKLSELISQEFPWFSGILLDTTRKRA